MDMQAKRKAEGDRTNMVLGRGLGLFSIGLGIAELAAPNQLARWMGVDDCGSTVPILRAFGAREALTGIGLLAKPQAAMGPWARVIGDALDMAYLTWAFNEKSVGKRRTVIALGIVAGALAIDTYAAMRRRRMFFGNPIRRTITIDRTPQEVYALWRDFERAPEFMTWVEAVQDLGDGRSHWKVRSPAGVAFEFDSEVIEDIPGQKIAWRSLPGAAVHNRGQVMFAPAIGGRGTDVFLDMQVTPVLAKTVASEKAKQDLQNLKTLLESTDGAEIEIVADEPELFPPVV